jgi:putative ABC transport system permease protein
MSVLQAASTGYLKRHPWQLALALLGIVIGVAVIVAVDLANGSSQRAFVQSMNAVTGRTTHQVVGGPGGFDEALYAQLRVEHGIRNIAPVVAGAAATGDLALRVLGVDLFAEAGVRDLPFVPGGGRLPVEELLTVAGSVFLHADTAAELGTEPGASFEIRVAGRPVTATLVGLIPAADATAGLRDLLLCDISTAQVWFGKRGKLTRIDAVLSDGAHVEQLRDLLPEDVQLLAAAGRTQAVADLSRAFSTNLTAMSLLALLVGVFLIYNSVGFAVLQRRNLIGVLRGLGVTRGQVLRLVLGEALLLGLAGAVLGVAAGVVLGQELLQLVAQSVNDLYFRVRVTDVTVQVPSLLKGLAAGMLATLAAAAVPAIEAAAYPPRLAQSRAVLEQGTSQRLPTLALAGLMAAALAVPLLMVSGQSLVAGLLALFMLILGFALGIPLFVGWAAGLLARPARRWVGTLGRLTVAGVAANLSRTGVAVVALAISVSATVGVSLMVGSFRLAVSDWLDNTLQSDLYVAAQRGELSRGTAAEIASLPGVAEVSISRRAWLDTESADDGGYGRVRLIAMQMASGSYRGIDLIDADPAATWQAFETDATVLVSEPFAYRFNISAGDSVYLPTDLGRRAFRVAAIYRSFDANPGGVLINRALYDLFWDDPGIDNLGVYLAAGADDAQIRAQLEATGPADLQLAVRSNAELRRLSLQIFDRTFLITNVLYWLAVIVAVVGIVAAMLALQLERARELATLRALGVTRGQLAGMLTAQSALLGLLSGLAAVPLGLLMAYLLVAVINRRAFGWSMELAVAAPSLWTALALALGAGAIAGLYPAWRAGRARPALAMRED